jgi:hypothetical protein
MLIAGVAALVAALFIALPVLLVVRAVRGPKDALQNRILPSGEVVRCGKVYDRLRRVVAVYRPEYRD